MNRALSQAYQETSFADALRKLTVVARGPKPVAALREMGLKPDIIAPEPNTWRELLKATEGRPERSIAVQEYGRSNVEFLEALRARGAEVTAVRVYHYGLPEDTAPLREAVRRLAAGAFNVAMFTTAVQIEHLLRVAEECASMPAVRRDWRSAWWRPSGQPPPSRSKNSASTPQWSRRIRKWEYWCAKLRGGVSHGGA